MMISSMNRTFDRHGKKVLLVLSILLSIVFIAFFSEGATGGCGSGMGLASQSVGSVFGRNVTQGEYMKHNEMISIAAGQNDPFANYAYDIFGIAAAEAAKQLGIVVSSDEIAEYTLSRFRQPSGEYDTKTFKEFLNNLKVHRGIQPAQFDQAVKHYLTIRKFYLTAPTPPIVTPGETLAFGDAENERFEASVAWFKSADYQSKAVVADTQISAAYDRMSADYTRAKIALQKAKAEFTAIGALNGDEEQKRFEAAKNTQAQALAHFNQVKAQTELTPDRFDALVACFPFNNASMKEEISKSITDSEIADLYETDKFSFMDLTDTRPEMFGKNFKPLESVKNELRTKIADKTLRSRIHQMAAHLVQSAEFDEMTTLPAAEQTKLFRTQAMKNGTRVEIVRNYSTMSCDIPGFGTENAVVEALNRQIDGHPMTEAIEGYQGYYVAFRTDLKPADIEPFTTAEPKIRKKLIETEAKRLAEAAAREYANEASTALLTGQSITSVKGPKLEPMVAFSPNRDSMPQSQNLQLIASRLLDVPAGQVSSVIPVENDFAIGYLKSRTLPTAALILSGEGEKRWERIKQDQNLNEILKWLESNTVFTARTSEE